jgi:hypothetical protein
MNTTFIINGGAGRVITAIPALEKFHKLNPDDNFNVIIHGWENLYWSHPILQSKTVGIHQKNIFEEYIKDFKLVCPEPYHLYDYYNQNISLSEAFDVEINKTTDHTDLTPPKLYVSTYEKISIQNIITTLKSQHKKNKVVVIQPYGSGMNIMGDQGYDNSDRSMTLEDYLYIGKFLYDNDCLVIFFGDPMFKHVLDNFSVDLSEFNPDLRMYMSFISECDYFIGCDSVGQHMAYSFNKPGSIFMGSTFEKNVSYSKHFNIFRKKNHKPTYCPIRLSDIDSQFTSRLNDGIMNFDREDIEYYTQLILKDIYDE